MSTEKITLPIRYWDQGPTRRISPTDENKRTLEAAYFFLAQFTGYSKHYPLPLLYSYRDKNLYLPMREKFMSLNRGTVYENTDMSYDMELEDVDKVCDTTVFYFVYNMANYYHFIYDTLPYLYVFFNEKKIHPEMKLLVSPPEEQDDLYPFVWDCLNMLGIQRDDVIFLDTNVLYNRVCIGSSLTHNGLSNCPPHKGVFEILNRMESDYVGPEKIYISRRTWLHNDTSNIGTNYTERRRCVNEDQVARLFSMHGFTEVFCENLTMSEKIGMFRNAKYIAGPIGGGMCNTIFSPPETRVLSINSPTFFDVNYRFRFSMEHTDMIDFDYTEFVDHQAETIDGDSALSVSGGLNSPWQVDLNKLSKFLDKWIQS